MFWKYLSAVGSVVLLIGGGISGVRAQAAIGGQIRPRSSRRRGHLAGQGRAPLGLKWVDVGRMGIALKGAPGGPVAASCVMRLAMRCVEAACFDRQRARSTFRLVAQKGAGKHTGISERPGYGAPPYVH